MKCPHAVLLMVTLVAMSEQLVVAKEPSAKAVAFLAQVQTSFAGWDVDHDGELSVTELDAAVADPQTRGAAAAAVAALKRASRSRRYKLPPLTLDNLEKVIAAAPAPERPDLAAMYADGLTRIGQANRSLFASAQPRLDTIHQGRLGNCYCLAPLGAVLHTNPERVAQMFQRQEDGSYYVVLGTRRVLIAPLTDAELAQTASNEQDGLWVNLYEKAIGESLKQDKPAADRVSSPIDALARGGSAGTILSYITGHKIQRFSCTFAKDEKLSADERTAILQQLRTWLREAKDQRQPMTCGTKTTTTPGLTPNHAYAVLGYDLATDAIELWNPHGGNFTPKAAPGPEHGYPSKDGIFSMPLVEFVKQFSGLAVETTLAAGDEPELPKLPKEAGAGTIER